MAIPGTKRMNSALSLSAAMRFSIALLGNTRRDLSRKPWAASGGRGPKDARQPLLLEPFCARDEGPRGAFFKGSARQISVLPKGGGAGARAHSPRRLVRPWRSREPARPKTPRGRPETRPTPAGSAADGRP